MTGKIRSLKEFKEIDLVEYLSSLGFKPRKVRNEDFWYLSPLREEKEASFKVNRKLNVWYDHGIGKGGNLIDFALLYHHCTLYEFLQKTEILF
jgi:DNA primase